MNYNFHCYNFNHTYIFLNIITLKYIDIVRKNDIFGNDWRKIQVVRFVKRLSLTPPLIFHQSMVPRSLVIHADMIG